jgi:23S rRNA G2445 N2-methylase RlmL
MAAKDKNLTKEHYQRLRQLDCSELWDNEVAAFDRANEKDRVSLVAVVRAVGVVFSECGTPSQREQARSWLRKLLNDPQEKVRRYAMTALPKLGGSAEEEKDLLGLLATSVSDREKKHLGQALEKIGGAATLAQAGMYGGLARTVQKAQANLARFEEPGSIFLDVDLSDRNQFLIHLRCRRGLERILEAEVTESAGAEKKFLTRRTEQGLVVLEAIAPFRLSDLFSFRCFASVAFLLGSPERSENEADALSHLIASPRTLSLLQTLTDGPIRYRLDFSARGHQRGLVREVTDRVFELCPALINDSRHAPWQIDIHQNARDTFVELTPKLRPDPRFSYRMQDVPAASHPPLAAAMARLAGHMHNEAVWDPFCGSGLELIECALRGGVARVIGTDRSADAIPITEQNFQSALSRDVTARFVCSDFRDHARIAGLEPGSISLVISNPPMGRRVPIPNLPGLIKELFIAAAAVLKPGGRLVFANPLPVAPMGLPLRRDFQQKVDLGGFSVHVERYIRL